MHAQKSHVVIFLAALAALGGLVVFLVLQLAPPVDAAGQERSTPPGDQQAGGGAAGEEQAIRKAAAAYVEAMNRGDLDARLALWTADADYIDEAGKVTRGREALAALFKNGQAGLKGTKVTMTIRSLKFLRPEVAITDGTLEYASADGLKEATRYVVVWTRSGDRWLISSARDLPAEASDLPSLAYAQLVQLEWLVGEWQAQSDKKDVGLVCRWDQNKSFLLMEYDVKRTGEEPLRVRQRVGWDGRNGMIRSWVFDSLGGFGEGYWERDGNRWIVGASGILPDGAVGGATLVYEFLDADSFIWRSLDRDVDGQPVADTEIKFVRKAPK
jgi:uncharacterized protein (TIGR02246 family)